MVWPRSRQQVPPDAVGGLASANLLVPNAD